MRVAIIAHCEHPIRPPFAGGLESLTWHLVDGLTRRGIRVSLFAAPGTDPALRVETLTIPPLRLSAAAKADVSMRPERLVREHFAYQHVMLALSRRTDIDLVHNNSLHYLPVAMAEILPMPTITTLHTPPTPWLEPAAAVADRRHATFVAVSAATAAAWSDSVRAEVIPNGIDAAAWPAGPGGSDLVWFGRLTPEKGPHLAIEIARRAGRRLRLAGPVADARYVRERITPRLGAAVRYAGHLAGSQLAELVGNSAATLVTPCWEEPYGLVAAESMACGTPVVAFAKGGVPEVVGTDGGILVRGEDEDACVRAAALAVPKALALTRERVRAQAITHCCVDRMVEEYLRLYDVTMARRVRGAVKPPGPPGRADPLLSLHSVPRGGPAGTSVA